MCAENHGRRAGISWGDVMSEASLDHVDRQEKPAIVAMDRGFLIHIGILRSAVMDSIRRSKRDSEWRSISSYKTSSGFLRWFAA
jgi:hypothetical protein